METEEFVARVICSIPAREFTIFSDEGKVTKVQCETPEEFQNVLNVCKETQEFINLEFKY